MAQLAIKGHKKRGKEVIEILKMLGYINSQNYSADTDSLCFCGAKNVNIIYYDWINNCYNDEDIIVFTLEEFLEKFPYKVGDKVQHKGATSCGSVFEVEKMRWVGTHVEYTVKRLWYHNGYSVVTAKDLQPFEEETMGKAVFDTNAQCCDISNRLIKEETMEEKLCIGLFPVSNGRKEIIPCDGYEVVSDEGKFYVVKKPPKYPKTHVECCEILYPNENFQTVAQTIKGHHGKKLFALQKLLVCRDAYWKIAGEQMGLGKPWEPDYTDDNIKHNITTHRNELDFNCTIERNYVLIFPTAEMRVAFYENFKELIEQCKELL